jgi:hypothetical protein
MNVNLLLAILIIASVLFALFRPAKGGRTRVDISATPPAAASFPRWQFWRGWPGGVRRLWSGFGRPAMTADGQHVVLSATGNEELRFVPIAEWKKAEQMAGALPSKVLSGGVFNILCFAAILFSIHVLFPKVRGWYVLPPTLGKLTIIVFIILVSFGMTTIRSSVTGMTPNRLQPFLLVVAIISLIVATLSVAGVLYWFTPWDPRW